MLDIHITMASHSCLSSNVIPYDCVQMNCRFTKIIRRLLSHHLSSSHIYGAVSTHITIEAGSTNYIFIEASSPINVKS